jgi:hypothetical protein
MTTTQKFQQLPDFYKTVQSCKQQRCNTNPRYPSFTQIHFTAGDKNQFETYRDPSNGEDPIKDIQLTNNFFYTSTDPSEIEKEINWKKYQILTTESVDNTFNYIFNKFKKGVFVKIKDNTLDVFLPFNKINYINEWGDRVKEDPRRFKSLTDFIIYCNNIQGFKTHPDSINKNPWEWYANNCLFRYENPPAESDSDLSNFKDMLETLCKDRKVPDIEFFLNKRDFPLLKKK